MKKILWESKGKALNGESYLSVRSLDGYYYAQRAGTNSVAFILYNEYDEVGLLSIYHGPTPIIRDCAFTGSLDNDELTVRETVIAEVKEESGYTVKDSDLIHYGQLEVGTQTNEMVDLYIVKVIKDAIGKREPTGKYEEESKIYWMAAKLAACSRDWKATILAQHIYSNIKK